MDAVQLNKSTKSDSSLVSRHIDPARLSTRALELVPGIPSNFIERRFPLLLLLFLRSPKGRYVKLLFVKPLHEFLLLRFPLTKSFVKLGLLRFKFLQHGLHAIDLFLFGSEFLQHGLYLFNLFRELFSFIFNRLK